MPSRHLLAVALLLLTQTLVLGGPEEPKPALPVEAVWVMKYDIKLNGELNAKPGGEVRWRISSRNDRLSGSLAEMKPGDPKDHKLSGEVVAGKTPLVNIRQDGPGGLTCFYTGKLVENRMVGTWYDNRGGGGDFEMSVEKK
jgi:hypothetical protein